MTENVGVLQVWPSIYFELQPAGDIDNVMRTE